MDFGLTGKRALVTGASAGLGFACAQTLAAEGAQVVINGRDQARLEKAAKDIKRATGADVGLALGDLSNPADRMRIINAARDFLTKGGIDILVSNTGGPPPGEFLEHSGDAWAEAGKLLLESAVGLTRAVLPGMLEEKWGRLIYITSVAVLQPVDELVLSNSYRAGVTGLCKSLSNTYASKGVTANTVCPGFTATERLASLIEQRAEKAGTGVKEMARTMAESVPAGRLGQPEELASLVAFLASDKAAYISGSSIAVDGGLHRGLL